MGESRNQGPQLSTQTFWRNFEVCSQKQLSTTFDIVLHARQSYICGCSLSYILGPKNHQKVTQFSQKIRFKNVFCTKATKNQFFWDGSPHISGYHRMQLRFPWNNVASWGETSLGMLPGSIRENRGRPWWPFLGYYAREGGAERALCRGTWCSACPSPGIMPWEDLRFNPHFPTHNALTVTPLARPSSSRQRFFLLAKFFQKAKLKIKNVKKDCFWRCSFTEVRRKKKKKGQIRIIFGFIV